MRYYWLRESLLFPRKQSPVPATGFSSYTGKASKSPRWIRSPVALGLISPLERCTSVSNVTLRNTFRAPSLEIPRPSYFLVPFWAGCSVPSDILRQTRPLPEIAQSWHLYLRCLLSSVVSDAQMNRQCWNERWEFFNCVRWTIMILNPFYTFSNNLLVLLWGMFGKKVVHGFFWASLCF